MSDLLENLIARFGFRLTTAELGQLLKLSPAEIRNQISEGTFPIPVGVDAFHNDFFADVRDVEIYLDESRPGKPQSVPEPKMAWHKKRLFVFERDNYTCQYCGVTNQVLEIDHVIPKSRGGTNDTENLKAACWDCNRSKGSRLLEEWARPVNAKCS